MYGGGLFIKGGYSADFEENTSTKRGAFMI